MVRERDQGASGRWTDRSARCRAGHGDLLILKLLHASKQSLPRRSRFARQRAMKASCARRPRTIAKLARSSGSTSSSRVGGDGLRVMSRSGPGSRWGRLAYARRVVAIALHDPREAVDRLMGRAEIFEISTEPGKSPLSGNVRWEPDFHAALGAPWPCPSVSSFEGLWTSISDEIEDAGVGHDADVALARAVHCAVTHTCATTVVETGVARGVPSRIILEALAPVDGHLWSVDLPPVIEGWHDQSGAAVPSRLRSNWHFIQGSSWRRLRSTLVAAGEPRGLRTGFSPHSAHGPMGVQHRMEFVDPRGSPAR